MKKYLKKKITWGLCALFLLLVMFCKKRLPRIPNREYTKACLYMAVLDDEICRNELEGNFVGEKEIVFPPKPDSLQYRYHLFLESYKGYTQEQIAGEMQRFEKRLIDSRKFCKNKN
ncbi:hypothetical protein [Anaerotignum sp.]|uniref:hypothetical protein n=1 Tax=Anaerotignum sp. TaxID=2039241 RepID=UPI0033331111